MYPELKVRVLTSIILFIFIYICVFINLKISLLAIIIISLVSWFEFIKLSNKIYHKKNEIVGNLILILSVVFISKYSKRPLHVFGFIGFSLFFIGMIINSYLTYSWFLGEALTNRPLLFLGILLSIVGIQIFSIGFIAELIVSYMSKESDQAKQILKK